MAGAAIAMMREEGVAWLRTFPEPRRSRMIARFGNPYLLGFLRGCVRAAARRAARGLAAPDCGWFTHDAEGALRARADGRPRRDGVLEASEPPQPAARSEEVAATRRRFFIDMGSWVLSGAVTSTGLLFPKDTRRDAE
ncbi:MAG: hypothetical protein U0353_34790 [Sandaracinus sp.]